MTLFQSISHRSWMSAGVLALTLAWTGLSRAEEPAGPDYTPPGEYSTRLNVAGNGAVSLINGILYLDSTKYYGEQTYAIPGVGQPNPPTPPPTPSAATYFPTAFADAIYQRYDYGIGAPTTFNDGSAGSFYYDVKSTTSEAKEIANQALSQIFETAAPSSGDDQNVRDLLDQGLYVTYAGTSHVGTGAYALIGNLEMNNDPNYSIMPTTYGYLLPGAMDMPLGVLTQGGRQGVILVPYASIVTEVDWAAQITAGNNQDTYTPLYIAADVPEHIDNHNDYIVAMAANSDIWGSIYQGVNYFKSGGYLGHYTNLLNAGVVNTYADYVHMYLMNIQRMYSGEVATFLTPRQIDSVTNFTSAVKASTRTALLTGIGYAPGTSRDRSGYDLLSGIRVWGDVSARYAKGDRDGTYLRDSYDEYGFTLGADKRFFGNNVVAGGAISYAFGELTAGKGLFKNYGHNLHAELYAGAAYGDFLFNAGLGYSKHWWRGFDYEKHWAGGLTFADRSDSHQGDTWNVFAEVAYRWDWCDWMFMPSVGLDYVKTTSSQFSWGNVIRMNAENQDTFRTPLRLSAYRDFDGVIAHGRVGWTHDWNNSRSRSTTSILSDTGVYNSFTVSGREAPNDYWNVGLGVDFNLGKFGTSFNYDYYFGTDYSNHALNFRAQLTF